jgi:hypothetical protein
MKELIKFIDKNIAEIEMLEEKVGLVEKHFDKEVMFNHDNKTYLWLGDFSISCEFVTINKTNSFTCLQDQSDVELTNKLAYVLLHEILNNN